MLAIRGMELRAVRHLLPLRTLGPSAEHQHLKTQAFCLLAVASFRHSDAWTRVES